jgi:hypothetical protein
MLREAATLDFVGVIVRNESKYMLESPRSK